MITPNQYLWMKWKKENPDGTWEEFVKSRRVIKWYRHRKKGEKPNGK